MKSVANCETMPVAATVEFHPSALAEVREARRWYALRSGEIADAFLFALDRVVERITTDPSTLPEFLHGTQRCTIRRFPYVVVFRVAQRRVQVIAVAHVRRRPGYWRSRLSD
jgi:plasmid stabilization system protein ParE